MAVIADLPVLTDFTNNSDEGRVESFGPFSLGLGNDTVAASSAGSFLDGEGGDDSLIGQQGQDQLFGGFGNDTLLGGAGNDNLQGGDGDDLINPGANLPETWDNVVPGQDNDTVDMRDINLSGLAINHFDLNDGIDVTINAQTNTGIIRKDDDESTRLLGVANPMSYWGLEIGGTMEDDTYNITLGEEANWFGISPQGGFNEINILGGDGTFRVSYYTSPNGIRADLGAGLIESGSYDANLDIFASEDRITPIDGVRIEISATIYDDDLTGSAFDDRFILYGGNDTVDGGAGEDLLRYDRFGVGAVNVDLAAGRATGNWNGNNFTHTISNIEIVRGSRDDGDRLTGDDQNNMFDGKGGADTITGGLGDDTIIGGEGGDTAVINASSESIGGTANARTLQVVSTDGTDEIYDDVEFIQFTDQILTYAQLTEVLQTQNAPPTGGVEITGEALVGVELVADTSTLADANGLGTLQYQWFNTDDIDLAASGGVITVTNPDGSTSLVTDSAFDGEAAGLLTGETGRTYTPTLADAGKTISVRVSYVDGGDTDEYVDASLGQVIAAVTAGGATDDLIDGTPSREQFLGGEGNDTISGGGGADVLWGQQDDDALYGDGFAVRFALNEANQVFRLYQATFDRAPDSAGHQSWTEQLASGAQTLAQVTQGFTGSREFANAYAGFDQAEFVQALYRNVLNRDFDQGQVTTEEVASWTDRMDAGLDRAGVVNGFSESREFQLNTQQAANALAVNSDPALWSDDIYRLYQATLDRAPDIGGFNSWSSSLSEGTTLIDVISGFTNSREFQNTYGVLTDAEDFVKLLYNNVLGRDFDAGQVTQGEITSWTSQLSDTFTRAHIVQGFSQSAEFTNNTAAAVKEWIRAQGVDDELDGGAGTNVLAGGYLADLFVFDQADGATNTVRDLEAWDFLSFEGFGYASSAAALAQMEQVQGDVVFADQGTRVTLEQVQLGSLSDDMILV